MNETTRAVSHDAFQAYNAMETTKRRHFDYLSMLEAAGKKWNLAPTAEQEVLREKLLADHDAQVRAFKACSAALKERDPQAFDALWAYIGEINEAFRYLNEREGH